MTQVTVFLTGSLFIPQHVNDVWGEVVSDYGWEEIYIYTRSKIAKKNVEWPLAITMNHI